MKNRNDKKQITCAICGEKLPKCKFYMNEKNEKNPFCKDCNKFIAHHRDRDYVLKYLKRRSKIVITEIEDKETRMNYIRASLAKVKKRIEMYHARPDFERFV